MTQPPMPDKTDDMMLKPDLLPCPCCNGVAMLVEKKIEYTNGVDVLYEVRCWNDACGVRTNEWYPAKAACETWNTRPAVPAASGEDILRPIMNKAGAYAEEPSAGESQFIEIERDIENAIATLSRLSPAVCPEKVEGLDEAILRVELNISDIRALTEAARLYQSLSAEVKG